MQNRFSQFLFLLIVLGFGLASTSIAAEPELLVGIDKKSIYLGESFVYQLVLNHVEDPGRPDLTAIKKKFGFETLGDQSRDQHRLSIINGVRQESVLRSHIYQYRLTPKEAGIIRIPKAFATVDGQKIYGDEVEIRVIAPEAQDFVLLDMQTDKESVYPMQPFTVTLTVSVIGLPDKFSDQDPMAAVDRLPNLSIPWMDDDKLPDGIEPEKEWNEVLQPIVSQRGGFAVNSIRDNNVMSFFNGPRSIGFSPKPVRDQKTKSDGKQAEYWNYTFSRKLIPKAVGDYEFGPITTKGRFVTGVRNQRAIGEDIFAVAKPVTVTVKSVPDEGRPNDWNGAIGKFRLSAELNPTTASVGDPLTLKLTLNGEGTLEQTKAPDLALQPEIAANFKIYDATVDTNPDGGRRTFTYTLRPTSTQPSEFPEIMVSSFDVEDEQFVKLSTLPIPLKIKEASRLDASDIVAGKSAGSSDPRLPIASEDGIFGNHSSVLAVNDDSVHPEKWAMAWLGLIAFGIAGSFASKWMKSRNSDPLVLRKRNAFSRAKTSLTAAQPSVDSIQSAITGLVADLTGSEEAGLAARDAQEKLRLASFSDDVVQSVGDFLERCDGARYGSAEAGVGDLKTEAQSLMDKLQTGFRQTPGS